MVEYRSVSQVKELLPAYGGCPHQYYLKRIKTDENGNRLWQRPAAWFPQGLAVHETIEKIERSGRTLTLEDAVKIYTAAYDTQTNRLCEDTPNFAYWFRSGPYDGRADIPRRHDKGKEQIERYFDYMAKYPDDIPDVFDGEQIVEYPFTVKFGDVEVRGVMDQMVKQKPIDVKSGNKPGDPIQLGAYAGVAEILWDIKPSVGFFWMGKTGKLTVPYDLADWTPQKLADVFGEADEAIREERFDPDPEPSKCMFCPVSEDCKFAL